ncbi:peptide ABC transporter substrate-binding protein [Salinispira pacifica]|uniref:Oligopeptide ABC transporter, periplasmic oligopeptide-binding protein OppA n=1 Tax=Salinispira pacifica TaxID=1307761 RepID=V5WLU6_9SPIO|nr:peptide ABC transporter substrate-binding protein [Salinispira pacifica]AHC16608.1 Oligopeptide ABC transporter, periplasmic oligopeptide-binding protein OppA [Salinispira pacifica]
MHTKTLQRIFQHSKGLLASPLMFLLLFTAFLLSSGVQAFGDESTEDEDQTSSFIMSLLPSNIEFNPLYTYSSLEAQVYSALFEGLVSYDPFSLEPIPGVARRWEILEEGTLYRFHLRQGARYWNGDTVRAEDFRDTWLKLLDPETDAPFAFLLDPVVNAREYRRGRLEEGEKPAIRVVDSRTLEVELHSPAQHFLSILAHQSLVPVHPDALEVRDWSGFDSPPGNGPYYIVEQDESHIRMKRNELYWDRRNSHYDEIIIEFNENHTATTRRFNSGEIHWIYSGFDLSELNLANSLQITPQFSTSYYFINSRKPPFDDPRIREALLKLLPLEQIRSDEVHFVPATTLVPQIPGYPDVEGIEQTDAQRAQTLLEEAGYPSGDGLPDLNIVLTPGSESRRVSELMKTAWEEQLDVQVRVEFIDFARYQRELKDSGFTVGSLSWIGDYADPMSFLQMWDSDSSINDAGYSDDTYDRLLTESNSLTGLSRYEKLAEAEQHLLDSSILLPVNHSPAIHLVNLDAVGGWYPNPLDIHPFKYLYEIKLTPPSNIAGNQ